MKLKKLELTNFAQHSHLILEFDDGINILWGRNDIGKTNCLAAIKWLCYNEGKRIIKDGTKKASVKGWFDNGCIVEKIKSATINAYIVTKDGKELPPFNSINKEIPEEVRKVLGLSPTVIGDESIILNMADQASKFLVGKEQSPTFNSKLFNKLTGNDISDKVLQGLNKDILKISKESKTTTIQLEDNQQQLDSVNSEKEKSTTKYNKINTLYNKLELLQERYNKLENIQDKLNKLSIIEQENKAKLKSINIIPNLDITKLQNILDRFNNLNNIKENLDRIDKTIVDNKNKLNSINTIQDKEIIRLNNVLIKYNKLKELSDKLNIVNDKIKKDKVKLDSIKVIDIDIDGFKDKLDRFNKLKDIKDKLIKVDKKIITLKQELDIFNKNIKANESRYKEILKLYGKCPICQTKLEDKLIEEIKL